MIRVYPLLRGLASYGLPRQFFIRPGTGGSHSAAYCYSVWLRHLVQLQLHGLIHSVGELKRVAEVGPGDSLGTGMAALYSGALQYTALDIIRHSDKDSNLQVNEQLLGLFLKKANIPHREFPDLSPVLSDYLFPEQLLSDSDCSFRNCFNLIKQSVSSGYRDDTVIQYLVPWMQEGHTPINTLDLIFSQAAMEHVDDIDRAYRLMYNMLRQGGIISHQVDFRAHEMTAAWDGHFYIRPFTWRILAHGRKYPMNRLPLSAHLKAIAAAGFSIVSVEKQTGSRSSLKRKPAVPRTEFENEDLVTMGALIQAVKS